MIIMRTLRTLLCAAFLLTVGYPLDTYAQSKNPVVVQVGQLFDQAQAAFAKGDKQGAYEAYKAAWGLQKSFDIAGNLGNVELKLGKYRDAAEHLSFSLENFPPTGEEAQQKTTERKLAEALKEVGRLHVQVSANGAKVDGADITVNGKPTGTPIASTVFVDPGPVSVEAALAGYLGVRQQLVVAKGEEKAVMLAFVPLPSPRRSVVPGAVMGGLAGAALVTGVVLEVVATGKGSSVKTTSASILSEHHSCVPNAANYDPRCQDIIDTGHSADSLHNAGVGTLIGAGALAAGSIAYFLWPASKPGGESGLRAVPLVSTTGAGMSFSGWF